MLVTRVTFVSTLGFEPRPDSFEDCRTSIMLCAPCSGTWTRTTILCFRNKRPAIRRFPNGVPKHGFEPRYTTSKAVVLPLDDLGINFCSYEHCQDRRTRTFDSRIQTADDTISTYPDIKKHTFVCLNLKLLNFTLTLYCT